MTVIIEHVSSIAGADDNTIFGFQSIHDRESFDGTGMITSALRTMQAKAGVLTTPPLDPGPTIVHVGSRRYKIQIPDSPTPIRLWPLIQAGLPIPPAQEADAIRNLGGIRGGRVAELDDYQAIPTPDPETLYFVPE